MVEIIKNANELPKAIIKLGWPIGPIREGDKVYHIDSLEMRSPLVRDGLPITETDKNGVPLSREDYDKAFDAAWACVTKAYDSTQPKATPFVILSDLKDNITATDAADVTQARDRLLSEFTFYNPKTRQFENCETRVIRDELDIPLACEIKLFTESIKWENKTVQPKRTEIIRKLYLHYPKRSESYITSADPIIETMENAWNMIDFGRSEFTKQIDGNVIRHILDIEDLPLVDGFALYQGVSAMIEAGNQFHQRNSVKNEETLRVDYGIDK